MFNNPFSMVVAIVLIVMIARVMTAKYNGQRGNQRDGLLMPPPTDNREAAALKEEVRALKERVAVLERIATDSHEAVRIDQEIARLRDVPAPVTRPSADIR
mgnify:CR=1 FL=1